MEYSENRKSEIGDEEKKEINNEQKKLGGIKTVPFIFGNEVCDRFATIGFHANLISYLTLELNLPIVMASNILSNFAGTGLICITTTAVMPSFRPPPCPTRENCQQASGPQLLALYLSLLLTSLGVGGIRPSLFPFAADQFDLDEKGAGAGSTWNFFNWYNFGTGVSLFLALTIVVYVQDNVGWGWGLGIPTIAFAMSIVAFVGGSKLYKKMKPGGSPLVRLTQVIVAAVRKRKEVVPDDCGLLYQNKEIDAALSSKGRLLHTDQFRWLDRAAIVTEDDTKDPKPNLWKIATIHRVEELKSIVRMIPIWGAAVLLVASSSGGFTIIQARTMDRHITSSFEISPASLSIFTIVICLVGIPIYERLFVPFIRRFTKNPAGITCLQRIGVAYGINIFSNAFSAIMEAKRKQVAAKYNLLDKPASVIPISVFWLVPGFVIDGIADVFWAAGSLEFLYGQAPESMRSTTLALYSVVISMGSYLGTFMVTMIHKYTGKEKNWLPDRNLNRGKLDYYYWLITGLSVINFVYFVVCACFYTYKPLEVSREGIDGGDVEVATNKIHSKALDDVDTDGGKQLGRIETV
ncbi:hypothetical protein LguiA_014297 [Lonicera macranthoides]